jgi:hypothetical protein
MITYDEAKKWYIQGVNDAIAESEEGSIFGDGIDADFYDQYRDQFPPDESPTPDNSTPVGELQDELWMNMLIEYHELLRMEENNTKWNIKILMEKYLLIKK